jgi:nucleotide-binding universal stress UspA family protein
MATPPNETKMQHGIVVGIDGSKDSANVLIHAIQLGEALHCGVHAVITYVIPPIAGLSIVPTVLWDPRGDAVIYLERTIGRAFRAGVPRLLSYSTIEGPAAHTLIDASKNAEMLVVGSHGHGGVSGLLLGSLSVACAEHASCPVLVVHGSEEAHHMQMRPINSSRRSLSGPE